MLICLVFCFLLIRFCSHFRWWECGRRAWSQWIRFGESNNAADFKWNNCARTRQALEINMLVSVANSATIWSIKLPSNGSHFSQSNYKRPNNSYFKKQSKSNRHSLLGSYNGRRHHLSCKNSHSARLFQFLWSA